MLAEQTGWLSRRERMCAPYLHIQSVRVLRCAVSRFMILTFLLLFKGTDLQNYLFLFTIRYIHIFFFFFLQRKISLSAINESVDERSRDRGSGDFYIRADMCFEDVYTKRLQQYNIRVNKSATFKHFIEFCKLKNAFAHHASSHDTSYVYRPYIVSIP